MSPVGRLYKRSAAVDAVTRVPVAVRAPGPDEEPAPHERVLVVDGDRAALARTTFLLAAEGYRVSTARSASEAWRSVRGEQPALVVIRARLPDGSGLEFVRRLRLPQAGYRSASILLLAPGAPDEERLRALALGADECLAADVADAELLLRARALLRRAAPPAPRADEPASDEVYELGPLRVNATSLEVRLRGRELALSRTEFTLLRHLVARAGQVIGHDELRRLASGTRAPLRRASARMHVHRLRAKLGADAGLIQSVPRRGYALRLPPTP